jgi:DUF4097 and DUF4098 domain-containing protein YvlB
MPERIRVALFSVALLGVLFQAGSHARADEWTRQYTLTGKPEVHVTTNDGNVRVDTWDKQEIEARVKTIGWRIANNEVHVIDRQSGNQVELEVREPHSWNWNWGGRRHSIKIELKIPRESSLQVNTKDGNIELYGAKGELRLSTGDGKIDASGIDGRLIASTGDGHIHIEGRFDQLDLRTGDGHIEARALPGSKLAAGWNLRTGDGNVLLHLPADLQADLDAHTHDGHITLDFPVTVSGSLGRSTIRGKINGGGAMLTVHTGDGSIRLEKL